VKCQCRAARCAQMASTTTAPVSSRT
jgi:hypothetical protein